MNAPEVSIVMPVWNAADTMSAAIESILRQTFSRFEFIVYDDGSTGASPAIAETFAARDPRVRVVHRAHHGIVTALREACALAQGRYLARMDADDIAYPERLEKQFALMEATPDVALCGTHVHMAGGKVGIGRRRYERWINALDEHEAIARELFVECPVAHPTFFMRREAYVAVGGYQDADWPEDYDLVMRLWLAGHRFAKVPEVLLDWYEHSHRHSMVDPRYSPEQFRALKRHYLQQSYLVALCGRRFFQWGAGEVGKVWLREWEGLVPEGVVDINPRKIGRRIHGVPVVAPEDLPSPGQVFAVIAVGAPGARDEIREFLTPRGYRECVDYLFVA